MLVIKVHDILSWKVWLVKEKENEPVDGPGQRVSAEVVGALRGFPADFEALQTLKKYAMVIWGNCPRQRSQQMCENRVLLVCWETAKKTLGIQQGRGKEGAGRYNTFLA